MKGKKIPPIGLGTWKLKGEECTQVVKEALQIGYRHIDTAHVYGNHKAIHKALQGYKREDLFLTSKIALEQVNPKSIFPSVRNACERALRELGTDYLDLYLIHSPDRKLPLAEIFKAMGRLIQEGKIAQAGVSNFTIHHLQDFLKEKLKPAVNQVEFHPYLYQKELWEFCKSKEIEIVSYRSFGKGALLTEPAFMQIAAKHGKTSAQVILRWLYQKEIPAIPKASSEMRLRENSDIFDFELDRVEMTHLDQLHKSKRFCMAEDPEFSY